MTSVEVNRDAILQQLQPLLERHPVKLLVLFGSQAREQTHPASDIDLGIMMDQPFDTWEVSKEIMALLECGNIDVIDMRRAIPLLAMAIATHGQVLYEREPGLFHRFQSLAARRYADTEKLRRLSQHYIDTTLQRITK